LDRFEEIQEERDATMRSEYIHQIETFSNQIDQLLDALNHVSFIWDKERIKYKGQWQVDRLVF
jgi:hypothetical protein